MLIAPLFTDYSTAAADPRAKFDSIVSKWKQDNPRLASKIADDTLNTVWQHISGKNASTTQSKRIRDSDNSQQRRAQKLYTRQNVTSSDVETARSMVVDAIAQQGEMNKQSLSNPRRNIYTKKPAGVKTRSSSNLSPLLTRTTPGLAEALPIVAEADAAILAQEGKLYKDYAQLTGKFAKYNLPGTPSGSQHEKRADPNSWFLPIMGVGAVGALPFGGNTSAIFRNVLYYGAWGDGIHDDTAAINFALNDGCGQGCGSTTTRGAVVYFPPGKMYNTSRGNTDS
jgi:Pectate lyase superfamily protein